MIARAILASHLNARKPILVMRIQIYLATGAEEGTCGPIS